jgi:microcystin-dependent protein
MDIYQNMTVYALLGTYFGGDGQTTFALPDLRGRAIVHTGWGYYRGMNGGIERAPMVDAQVGSHTHAFKATSETANQSSPGNNAYANAAVNIFNQDSGSASNLSAQALGNTGGSVPHENMQPSLVMNYCIALDGVFPTRS